MAFILSRYFYRMSSDDSDDDFLLAKLLANTDDKESKLDNEDSSKKLEHNALKEIDINFLDTPNDVADVKLETSKITQESTSIIDNYADSSDDEDKKYFEKQKYSDYGREIKNLIKNKQSENVNFESSFKERTTFNEPLNNIRKTPKSNNINLNINNPSLSNNSNASNLTTSDKYDLKILTSSVNSTSHDVYKDPIFGLRIIRPLVSSAELKEKMQGRKPVTVSMVKIHLMNQSVSNTIEDWVIAGVLLNKTAAKTSQKGSQYCIWKISDLSADMKTVSVFLFNSAFKNFWKLTSGAVVGILNPSVLESRDDKDLATLSVDNSLKIMVLGTSKDLGKCKSRKKNGDPCTVPVNLSDSEYCVYHVKQEYAKFGRRSELQTNGVQRAFGTPNNAFKKVGVTQQRHPDALPFMAIPAKRNETLYKKDCERLALLRGDMKAKANDTTLLKTTPDTKIKATSVELTTSQLRKDSARLNKLREWDAHKKLNSSTESEEKKGNFKLNLSSPKLGTGMKGGIIDFSEPISKNHVNKAKLNAIEWVKRNGAIKKENPNKIRPNKEILNEKGIKRKREEEQSEIINKEITEKKDIIKTKFQEMLELKSAHSDLIEKRESEETEQYFKKLETKERMEEKMLTTFKIECKAVRCSVCKYIAFSSSELCKKLQHPIKVIDAVKRFFKCGDCGNRTVSLDRIPTETCKKCSSSKWIKTAMMDEKRTEITNSKLCIRGGEEKFIGSMVIDASLNLLVPESD